MNILVLTSVYKDISMGNRDGSTPIVNTFAQEWVKLGHKVIVIHNCHCYPNIVHNLPKSIKQNLASKLGFPIPDIDLVAEKNYDDNGVKVYRLPLSLIHI